MRIIPIVLNQYLHEKFKVFYTIKNIFIIIIIII